MIADEIFMRRALNLAALGAGRVSPNPLVGCVIVQGSKIVGEGWHRQYGGAHAEVHAVDAVQDRAQLTGATVYVTLEPCAHTGKTPPCADLLARYPLREVVVANIDPNPKVSGRGVQRIRESGIAVRQNVLAEQSRWQNRRFFTFYERHRPHVVLKWAQTADGFIARNDYTSKWISNRYSRQLVHKWRTEEDAVLVGAATAHYDNPRLTARHWHGRDPLRIVIDRQLKLADDIRLFDGSVPTYCYNLRRDEQRKNLLLIQLAEKDFIASMLSDLYRKGVQSLLVEGGARTLALFIEAGLWDEARVFGSTKSFGQGISAPVIRGRRRYASTICGDTLEVYTPLRCSREVDK